MSNKGEKINIFKDITDLQYLRLNKFVQKLYDIIHFFKAIPNWLKNLFVSIGKILVKCAKAVKEEFVFLYSAFVYGSWKTKLSYVVMGFGSIMNGQILRGILFLVFELVFIVYMIFSGAHWLSKFDTLGTEAQRRVYNEKLDVYEMVEGDNSFKILLYGLLTIFFIIAFIYTWALNIRQAKTGEDIIKSGKKIKSGKEDVQSLLDDQFHKTLLALPLTGITMFTVFPTVFMILVAFTNFDGAHDGYSNLFTWVGLSNMNALFNLNLGTDNLSLAFGEILTWTLIWAFFATFTNYFLGMFVAMMINKKGIKGKKIWRGILVLTSAVPQFVTLLYISKMFAKNGIVNGMFYRMGWISAGKVLPFWEKTNWARVTIILINIWIGIPYLMLIATGILMNIPADLYESANVDGASPVQQFFRITLPYMLFVTGPYLLTSFIGNLNNFNVIYLLTAGGPDNVKLLTSAGMAGDTDLLITWLFKITQGAEAKYYLASVIGIMIFVVVSSLSLIAYNVMPSNTNEEDYS